MMNALAELEAGVADIALVPVGVQPGMPIGKANDSFGYGCPMGKEQEICWELWDEFPEWRQEYASVKTLNWAGGVTSFYIMTKEPVRTIEDIEGLILRGISYHVKPFQNMGAEVVTMSVTESYTAVEKGTVDGVILHPSFFKSYSMYEVVDYATCLHTFPMAYPCYCMNLDVWNSLPSDIQDIIDDSLEGWSEDWLQWVFEEDLAGLGIAELEGVEFIEFSAADLAAVHSFYEEVALEVAAELDADGLPGTEIFEEMRRLIEE
jgi:TRAP-type C4-dicarboxylate transport system substrate-binding protein